MEIKHRHLRLIEGGEAALGPSHRLNLAERLRLLSPAQIALFVATKLLLLASVLYFIYR